MTGSRWKHDVKNQVGIILGFSELLLQDMAVDDPRRADVVEILTAARRAMELVDSVSDVTGDHP